MTTSDEQLEQHHQARIAGVDLPPRKAARDRAHIHLRSRPPPARQRPSPPPASARILASRTRRKRNSSSFVTTLRQTSRLRVTSAVRFRPTFVARSKSVRTRPSPPSWPAGPRSAHQDQRAYPQGPQAHRCRQEEGQVRPRSAHPTGMAIRDKKELNQKWQQQRPRARAVPASRVARFEERHQRPRLH